MCWQVRDGIAYFYRSWRGAGGRVRTSYLGRGAVAELAAVMDLQRKIERLEEKERQAAVLARRGAADAALVRLCEAGLLLARAALLAAGYHQHDRGAWRRKRVRRSEDGQDAGRTGREAVHGGESMTDEHEGGPCGQAAQEMLRQVVGRAQKGDATVLPALRVLLDENPRLWGEVGDIARQAEEALIALAAGDDLLFRESLRRKAAALKAELAPASPLERVVVERIAACWLAANHADALSAQARGGSPSRPDQLRRRQDSANRRFLEAVKQLAMVRRLLVTGSGRSKPPPRAA